MSLNDSFISEVTEEVRRDRLYNFGKRYGWIVIAIILSIVFGSAINEWRKAESQTESEIAGDELAMILLASESKDITLMKSYIAAKKPGWPIATLKLSHLLFTAGKLEEGIRYSEKIHEDQIIPIAVRDLALLYKYSFGALDSEKALEILNDLSGPDRPYRLLAIENKINYFIELNSIKKALAEINLLKNESESTPNFKLRVREIEKVLLSRNPVD